MVALVANSAICHDRTLTSSRMEPALLLLPEAILEVRSSGVDWNGAMPFLASPTTDKRVQPEGQNRYASDLVIDESVLVP
jgi:hypothetical protein